MLLRLVLIIALIGAAAWFWRSRRPVTKPKISQPASEPMLRCAHCGVHIPRRLAHSSASNSYCSSAHMLKGPSRSEQ
jgi:uncharacterized protein